MLSLFILVPLVGLVPLNLPFLRSVRRTAFGFALAASALQALVAAFAPESFWQVSTWLDVSLSLHLSVDSLSRVMLLAIGVITFVAVLASRPMLTDPLQRFNFADVALTALLGMNGLVLLTDLFTFYVFLEIVSVASFVLIAFNRNRDSLEGAFKYFILSAVASLLMLGSIGLLVMLCGGTEFSTIQAGLKTSGNHVLAKLAMGMFLCGLLIKGGVVPFHGWLPAAYSAAPGPVSVLLAGIVTKASGIYALIRLTTFVFVPSVEMQHLIMAAGALSIVVGAVAAVVQTDVKRMLSYSSISQVGYIVLAVGCGTPLALAGAVLHLFNHSIFKGLLFVNSASLEHRLDTTDMNAMGRLGSKMPVTAVTSVLGSLSAAGVPPLAGFWSKLIIIVALWQANLYAYAVVAVFLSVVTLAYLLLMQRRVFFGQSDSQSPLAGKARFELIAGELLLAGITVGVGLALPWLWGSFLAGMLH